MRLYLGGRVDHYLFCASICTCLKHNLSMLIISHNVKILAQSQYWRYTRCVRALLLFLANQCYVVVAMQRVLS